MELIFCGCFKVIKYMKNPCYETGVLYNGSCGWMLQYVGLEGSLRCCSHMPLNTVLM